MDFGLLKPHTRQYTWDSVQVRERRWGLASKKLSKALFENFENLASYKINM